MSGPPFKSAPVIHWQEIDHTEKGKTLAARFGEGWLIRHRDIYLGDEPGSLAVAMVYVPDSVAFPDVVFQDPGVAPQ